MNGVRGLLLVAVLVAAMTLPQLWIGSDATAGQRPATVRVGDGTLLHAIARNRARTWKCQTALGRDRTPTAYAAERSPSLAFRQWAHQLWRARAAFNCRLAQLVTDPVQAIRAVFGAAASQALAVFRCESHLNPRAANGQYLGIAQMGHYARSTYGHSSTVLGQVRAAYRMWRAEGWRPWSCAYITGVI